MVVIQWIFPFLLGAEVLRLLYYVQVAKQSCAVIILNIVVLQHFQ